ncbi:hypothetical protein Cme02nite_46220 [Catellatospora methionotrophica]|uniref:Rho termination factor N-terminal domain-containing protein n=1 Tax=Catellatospora methionotrophica TaxID=121620 RepID=A0A8J3LP30_9ACTN|nr:hypothetical protein [Catellatospora methionotrophica]GIG16290.1 hypothetical protein Cme02nite_46220 [Catellatospora methionotrophica]
MPIQREMRSKLRFQSSQTKEQLLGVAKKMNITGRWHMTKAELARAIEKANDAGRRHSRDRD